MKIFVIVESESNWIPNQLFKSFRRHSSAEFVESPEQADLIWIKSYYSNLGQITALFRPRWVRRLFPGLVQRRRPRRAAAIGDKLVIATFAHLTPGKEDTFLPTVRRVDVLSDVIHFFARTNIAPNLGHFRRPVIHLPYWIDLDFFRPLTAEQRLSLRRRYELPEDRMIIGSFQRDTERHGDNVPKLEKGPDVLCDVLERLDRDRIFVVLSGPRRDYVEGRLKRAAIPYRHLGYVDTEEMPAIYGCLDRYLVTSRVEGGPQAIIECMATRTPIHSTPVGISDALSPTVICNGVDEFVSALSLPYPEVLDEHLKSVQGFDVRRVVPLYEQTFETLIAAHRANSRDLPAAATGIEWFNVG